MQRKSASRRLARSSSFNVSVELTYVDFTVRRMMVFFGKTLRQVAWDLGNPLLMQTVHPFPGTRRHQRYCEAPRSAICLDPRPGGVSKVYLWTPNNSSGKPAYQNLKAIYLSGWRRA